MLLDECYSFECVDSSPDIVVFPPLRLLKTLMSLIRSLSLIILRCIQANIFHAPERRFWAT